MPELLRRTGWIKLFRSRGNAGRRRARCSSGPEQYGVDGEILDWEAIAAREPNLTGEFAGARLLADAGIRSRSRRDWPRPMRSCLSARADASSWRCANARAGIDGGWRVKGRRRVPRAKPWWRSGRGPIWCFVRSGIRSRSASSAVIICISRRAAMPCSIIPVLDSDLGYLLAPMNRGIRLTTGVEFARRDAPPTPIQIERALATGTRAVSAG